MYQAGVYNLHSTTCTSYKESIVAAVHVGNHRKADPGTIPCLSNLSSNSGERKSRRSEPDFAQVVHDEKKANDHHQPNHDRTHERDEEEQERKESQGHHHTTDQRAHRTPKKRFQ